MSEGSGWFVKFVSKKSLAGGKTNDKIETVCALNSTFDDLSSQCTNLYTNLS